MSGNVTTAGDMNVMPGGALRVAKTTIGGNLENGGTVQMNSEGGKPGNVLTVNGNYTGNNGLMTFNATTVVSEIWGLVVVNEHDNHDRQRLDSSLVYTGAHNVYYVKSCLSDAKCFSGSRYSFRVQELKPLLFHNWPVHGEIAWLFPAPC